MAQAYVEQLRLASGVTAAAIRKAIQALAVSAGGRGLDAGCGIGLHTQMLTAALGRKGRVVGVDHCSEHLAVAREAVAVAGLGDRVEFVEGNVTHLPFDDATFDLVWCADTLWPVAVTTDPVAGVRELARVVRPGGTVALAYWSGQALLPGYPALEARLDSAFAATSPYLCGVAPRMHVFRALGWLQAVGLRQQAGRTYVSDLQAPLGARMRESLTYCLGMLWGNLEAQVSKEDWQAYQRLCDPASNQFILQDPAYYGFITYTVFSGMVP